MGRHDRHHRDDGDERKHHKKKKDKRHRDDVDDDDEEHEDRKASSSRHRHHDKKRRKHHDDSSVESRERKHKKKGRRHRDRDDASDDGSRKRKHSRHHRDSDKKRKRSSKHHRRDDTSESNTASSDDRHHKKKNSKSSKKHRDDKDSHYKIKKPDKSKLHSMGGPLGRKPDTEIDAEQDYFTYHQEFWIYLFREEGTAFNDLDTKQAKKAFARFAKRYNKGELEEPYYTRKIPAEVLEESKTTKHSWGFKTTEKERQGLEALNEGIRKQTEYDANSKPAAAAAPERKAAPAVAALDDQSRRRKTPQELMEDRRANKSLKESVRTAQEEVTGGAKDFRERQLEKKREHASRIHGASRDKEDGGAGVELADSALYGDEERSSFQSAVAREKRNKERRQERRQNRIEELQSKEEEKQKNMLKLLGLDNLKGQKIKIAPRKDG